MSSIESTGGYFVRLNDNLFRPTWLTGGAWTTSEQHISPMNGLIVHEVERFVAARGPDDLTISRISVDILGVIGLEPFSVDVAVVRPGRTIELLEVVVTASGRPAVRARVWRAVSHDTAQVAGGHADPLPDPEEGERCDLTAKWPGGFIESLDIRMVGEPKPGRATAWVAAPVALVAGEPCADTARLIGLVDTANGICARQNPRDWLFPNLDLTIHLFRQPQGRWLGLDTSVVFGPSGHGVTGSRLHDVTGHVGEAKQTLTIRPRPAT